MASKIFVLSDNLVLFKAIRKILNTRRKIEVDYYHSPNSSKLFEEEGNIAILNLKEGHVIDKLLSRYDLGISCHSKQIFPEKLVNNKLCINIHPGLNPYNRGWFPQVFSIVNKQPIGATIHVMDDEIDHGAIIAQREVVQMEDDTSVSLYNKVIAVEMQLLEENIDNIINGVYTTEMPKGEGNYNSIEDFKNLCAINMEKKVIMREAIDYLRAMSHSPYKNAYFINKQGRRIYISVNLQEES